MNASPTPQTLHFERLANVVALPIGRWDAQARLVFCNTPYLAWAGRSQEELLGRTLAELYGDDAWAVARPAFERAFGGEISGYERLLTHPPHPQRWARIQVFPDVAPDGRVASVFTIATDIHEDIVERNALVAARKRLDRFTDNIPLPLVYLDTGCRLRFVNKAWCRLVDIAAGDALGRHVSEVRGEVSWREQQPYYERALAGQPAEFSRLVHGVVDGPRWMRTSYFPDFDDEGKVIGVYTVTTDVHELTTTQEQLRRSAERDALTDALSRHTMMSFIECSIADPNQEFALFFIDLDGFKSVNDEKGHRAGDRLLAEIATALRGAVRTEDAVGRFGGDEFLVLARVKGQAGAQALAEHLCASVEGAAQASGSAVSASIGYALAPSDARDPLELLHYADAAMYAAKRSGKNRAMSWRQSQLNQG
ncbi:diguanylate cyclase domain-containing protein [Azospira restricta]|uniref:Diguanylate cyclase n=1 Tax=Azospira restricta TaxID=404405 RepID=A0A974PX66_9RHOO|nr:diguanylate cyclase [Azospira restricta]QRJ63119.1 diguanylate cyclase [Azospira restricta]